MREGKKGSCAPVKKRVILPALLAILLLAGAVCMLHWENAVSLRGTVATADFVMTDGTAQGLALVLDDPWKDAGIVHISGALMRMGQPVGAVNVRVGLIAEALGDGPAQPSDGAILLNTQMVRRPDLAQEYGCDDHCGFHASVDAQRLQSGSVQYRVVLVDESDGAKRMLETGMTVMPVEGGLAFGRVNAPEEEAQDAQ